MATSDQELLLEDGPWDGILDSVAPTARKEGKYLIGENLYPLDPAVGDGIVGRPGFSQLGAQGGSAGARRVQGMYQFTKKNGTEYSIRIVGGKFETLDWGTGVWSNVITAANLVTAAVAISAAANKIAFLTFHDLVLISDGVNTPWMWDGTAGAGGITKLTNAPVFYGQPTLFNARIFAIKASDPTTAVWSEADSPNTGYEAGGYNNAWNLTQTDPNRLYRLIGTNDAVYASRSRSSTEITGDVTANFSSSATRDALSETVGTKSPFAVVTIDTSLILFSADMQPHMLLPGGSVTPIWTPFREHVASAPKDQAEKALSAYYSPAGLLLMAFAGEAQTECNMMLVYDVKGPVPIGVAVWKGFEITEMAMLKDGSGNPVLCHGDTTGYTYVHGNPDGAVWDDGFASGSVAIKHVLELQALGFSTKREKIFDRMDISARALSGMTLSVSFITPRGQGAAQTVVIPPAYIGWDTGRWDQMVWDPGTTSTQEAHTSVGLDDRARWIKPHIEHQVAGERFGLVAVTVVCYPSDDDPEAP